MGTAIMPGWGTAIGAVAGGLYGGFGGGGSDGRKTSDEAANRKMLLDYYNRVYNRQAPQMGPAAQGSLSSFRQNQSDLVSRLEAMSRGEGPSLAAQQLRAATDRNSAQQASMANSGRGGPMAVQSAANNMGLLGAQAAQDSASARIAEQQMALGQLGQNLNSARGADEEMSRYNAGQMNDVQKANLDAKLRAMGMDDQMIARIFSELTGSAAGQATRPSEAQKALSGAINAYTLYAANKGNGNSAPSGSSGGSSGGGGGSGLAPL
jgi:hypothetical protein